MVEKISIIGNSAAGKSTLSRKLGEALSIDVFSIDKIFWMPGWKLRDRESFSNLHMKWMSNESWIIDGVGYWTEMVQRIKYSDQTIFLDLPVEVCKERAINRIIEEKIAPNPNITSGCVYGEARELQMGIIEKFHSDTRPMILELFATLSPERVKRIADISELKLSDY